MAKKTIFCAVCQADKPHELKAYASKNELVATCTCGHPVKFPLGSEAEVEKLIAVHKKHSSGQVIVTPAMLEAQENAQKAADALVDKLSD